MKSLRTQKLDDATKTCGKTILVKNVRKRIVQDYICKNKYELKPAGDESTNHEFAQHSPLIRIGEKMILAVDVGAKRWKDEGVHIDEMTAT